MAGGDRSWPGRLLVAPGRALYVGPAGDTRPHRHHALQWCLALEEPFEVQVEGGPATRHTWLLLGADRTHRVDGRGHPLALYYVDASSVEGEQLAAWLGLDAAREPPGEVELLRGELARSLDVLGAGALAHMGVVLMDSLDPDLLICRDEPSDPLVNEAQRILESELSDPPAVPELAHRLGVTQRDLSARFLHGSGLSIRRTVLWMRLKAAVASMSGGGTLTDAAHAAGFADAAHLSRTFTQMFGVPPSASVGASELVVADAKGVSS